MNARQPVSRVARFRLIMDRVFMIAMLSSLFLAFGPLAGTKMLFFGEVQDSAGKPIDGARVEWRTENAEGDRGNVGFINTKNQGFFMIFGKRLRGDRLVVTRISAPGYSEFAREQTFLFSEGVNKHSPSRSCPVIFVLEETQKPPALHR